MSKKFLILAAAVLVAGSVAFTSCKKSKDEFKKEAISLVEESKKAAEAQDLEALSKLKEKADKLTKEYIDTYDCTEEEAEKFFGSAVEKVYVDE